MSGLYENFEKRFTGAWFSAGWADVEAKPAEVINSRKDVVKLKTELAEIEKRLENISLNKLRLSNLAKLYEN